MYHEFLVNQKIHEDCKIKVNFINCKYLNWSYESFLGPIGDTDTPVFPIVVNNDNAIIEEKPQGRETICKRLPNDSISFMDDYSVPGGFLICVTSPPGYEPKVIKLKNKPTFNDNGFNNVIPTHFEVKSNRVTNQTSILMHVLERAYFGICIEFEKINGQVTNYTRYWFNNPYDLTLSLVDKELSIIEASDIKNLHPTLGFNEVKEFTELVNELIVELNKQVDKNTYECVSYNLKIKLAKFIPLVLGTSSSVVTLIDSYKNAGVLGELLTSLIKLFG